jgi:hypothetical protein
VAVLEWKTGTAVVSYLYLTMSDALLLPAIRPVWQVDRRYVHEHALEERVRMNINGLAAAENLKDRRTTIPLGIRTAY